MAFDIKLAQAKYIQHVLHPENMPSVAADALEAGYDTPSLRQLAGLINPTAWEAEPLWKATLVELNLPDISRHEAMMIVADDIAKRVLLGELEIDLGLSILEKLCSKNDYPTELIGFFELADMPKYGEYAPTKEQFNEMTIEAFRMYLARDFGNSTVGKWHDKF